MLQYNEVYVCKYTYQIMFYDCSYNNYYDFVYDIVIHRSTVWIINNQCAIESGLEGIADYVH